jgi:hypothetical protein
MTHSDPFSDIDRPRPSPTDRAPLAKPITDDALKEELLREDLEWDDLHDRMASMSDDMEE